MADLIQWWRTADLVARATVLGTFIAAIALMWSVATIFLPNGSNCTISANQSIAGCDDITVKGDIDLGNNQ